MTIIDDIDDELDMDESEIRMEVLRRARSEGALAAYESALEIVQDKAAPAVARASSQRTLLALAGLLDKTSRDDAAQKPVSEWSPDELSAAVDKLKRELDEKHSRSSPGRKGRQTKPTGVFG